MSEAGPIKAVVFDVDGVLVRAFEWARILETDHALGRSETDPFYLGPFKRCVLGQGSLRQELVPFVEAWGWKDGVDDFIARWFAADAQVDDHAIATVDQLRERGVPCYVASTQEAERAAYLREEMGFADHFDDFFFSCEMGVSRSRTASSTHS